MVLMVLMVMMVLMVLMVVKSFGMSIRELLVCIDLSHKQKI